MWCFVPELDCVLAFPSDVTAHRVRPRLTTLLCVPNQRNTTPLSSAALWSWIKATLSRASFYLFLSRGHMCANARVVSSDWHGLAENHGSFNASAYRAHMFGDRWSQRACRDCLRWASHLPLARNRATAGQGLHGRKEESVRVWVQL